MRIVIWSSLFILILAIKDGKEAKKDTEVSTGKLCSNHDCERNEIFLFLFSDKHAYRNGWIKVPSADIVGDAHHCDLDTQGVKAPLNDEGCHDEGCSEHLIDEHSNLFSLVLCFHHYL